MKVAAKFLLLSLIPSIAAVIVFGILWDPEAPRHRDWVYGILFLASLFYSMGALLVGLLLISWAWERRKRRRRD